MATPNSKVQIPVTDDQSLRVFLKSAKQAWEREHFIVRSAGGRSRKAGDIYRVIKELDLGKKRKSQNQLVGAVCARLNHSIHADTARAYVKKYREIADAPDSERRAIVDFVTSIKQLEKDSADLQQTYTAMLALRTTLQAGVAQDKLGPIKQRFTQARIKQLDRYLLNMRDGIQKLKQTLARASILREDLELILGRSKNPLA